MSERAVEFVEEWVAKHINAQSDAAGAQGAGDSMQGSRGG
jgi:hypothetical protein